MSKKKPPRSELRERIAEINEEAVLLEPASLDAAIVGTTHEGCVVYDRRLLAEAMVLDGMDPEDAEEFISFNTEGAIPSMGDSRPVLFDRLDGIDRGSRLATVERLAPLFCDACAAINCDPSQPHSVHQRPERFPVKPNAHHQDREVWRHRYHGQDYGRVCGSARLWEWLDDPTYDPWRSLREPERPPPPPV